MQSPRGVTSPGAFGGRPRRAIRAPDRASPENASELPACFTVGFLMAYSWFKLSDLITPIRVPKDVELEGLDGPEMGTLGYPDFQIHQDQRMAG